MNHTILIADETMAEREGAVLRRIALGLTTNGWRPTILVPHRVLASYNEIYAETIGYRSQWTRLGIYYESRALARRINRVGGPKDVALVHAVGPGSWGVARGLGERFGAPLMVEVVRIDSAARASRIRPPSNTGPVTLCAADPAIESALREVSHSSAIRSTPWGVHPAESPHAVLSGDSSASVVLLGDPKHPEPARSALIGACEALTDHEAVLIIDAQLSDAAGLWKIARSRGISPTLIDRSGMHDELLAQADIILVSQDGGRVDTSILLAMAQGCVVVSTPSSSVNSLNIPGMIRLVTESSAPDQWRMAISELIEDPESARQTGNAARRYIEAHRQASQHVGAVIDSYEWVLSNDSVPLSSLRS